MQTFQGSGRAGWRAAAVLLWTCAAWLTAGPLRAADAPFTVAGLGDLEKITQDGAVPASPHCWDEKTKTLKLQGGRNEMVAGQLILTAPVGGETIYNVDVKVGDLKTADGKTIAADPNLELLLEMYQYVAHGQYDWGPHSAVLANKKYYPEVLVPFTDPYDPKHKPVAAPFNIRPKNGPNQGVWLDLYIPRDAAPGKYTAPIAITIKEKEVYSATLAVTVHGFTIPDETHVDGFGEFYGGWYDLHGAGYKADPAKWWTIASRYHQMAHRHRFVICERKGRGPGLGQWDNYDKYYGAILDGSLFTAANGYVGPGANTGVSFWEAPFGQDYDGAVPALSDEQLKKYTEGAKEFWDHVKDKKWDGKRFLAYIIDEAGNKPDAVKNTKKLQEAIDAGAGAGHINLLWTSHSDPEALVKDGLDFREAIRWWAPNAGGCNAAFLQPQIAQGQTVWFYHHGHPNCGVHAVNATGIDLETWGAICWRYQVNGSFWWAMDLGDPKDPLNKPVYKPEDTRWGNGVLFYPGCALPTLGMDLPAIDGPLSDLRMKAYRRGLQDYEYGWLLKQAGKQAVADAAFKKIIPLALLEASKPRTAAEMEKEQKNEAAGGKQDKKNGPPATWSTDVNDWYQFREDLAAALEQK